MNSRMIKGCIALGVSMFFLLVLIIVMSNWKVLSRRFQKQPNTATVQTQEIPEQEPVQQAIGQIGNNLSGFLSDDDFFEKEESEVKVSYGNHVELIMNSVAQDLRVLVINQLGYLVIGEPFSITVEGMGTYVDEDKDGVIYLDHLRPGKYFVSLNPQPGYEVETTKTMINIKQQLEYTKIDNVRYLILTEKEVNTDIEDTAEGIDKEDVDDTEQKDIDAYENKGILGIDVSRYNEEIDWEKVAEAGVKFAIIRCGYRGSSSGHLIEDARFKENIKNAHNAGIDVGVYFFSQAVTEEEAVEEASMVLELCGYTDLKYPIYLDSESAGGKGRADGLEKAERTAITKAFCETIRNAGKEAGVYASRNWLNEQLDADALLDYSIWLAEYREKPLYDGNYDMWQYTSKGKVDGIETAVDLNISYRK